MKILVLGGTRFIGAALVKRLHERGHEVAVFNRGQSPVAPPEGVTRITGDLKQLADSRADFERFAPDVVLHNVIVREGNAIDAIGVFRRIAGRFVMVSSMDVYRAYGKLIGIERGDPDPTPLTEDSPVREVLYPYRAGAQGEDDFAYHYDKIPAERQVMNAEGLPGTVLRLGMIIGENDYQRRLTSFFKPMDDERAAVVLDENYAGWRSTYGYVENVAEAVALACIDDRAAGRVYNVGEFVLSTAEMYEAVKRVTGWNGEIITAPTADLPESLRADMPTQHHLAVSNARIREELGYGDRVPLDEALRRAIAWERATLPADADFPTLLNYADQDAYLAQR